jgi:hypothetical protein
MIERRTSTRDVQMCGGGGGDGLSSRASAMVGKEDTLFLHKTKFI